MTLLEKSNNLSKDVAVHFFHPRHQEKEIWDEIQGGVITRLNDYAGSIKTYARFMSTIDSRHLGARVFLSHTGSSGDGDEKVIPYGPGLGMALLATRRDKALRTSSAEADRVDLFLGKGQPIMSVTPAKAIAVMASFAKRFPAGELQYFFPDEASPEEAKEILDELLERLGQNDLMFLQR